MGQTDVRIPKDVRRASSPLMMDPYLRFVPVAAVPDIDSNSQISRQPKEAVNTLDINFNIPNTLKGTTRIPATRPPAPKARYSESSQNDKSSKRAERKKFKRCQGRCVQQFCLPVDNLDVYAKCVDKCKVFCT